MRRISPEIIHAVRPAVAVGVRTAVPAARSAVTPFIRAVISLGSQRVVGEPVAIAVHRLERVVGERIEVVCDSVEVRVGAPAVVIIVHRAEFIGTEICIIASGVVAVAVTVGVEPLGGIIWEPITVRAARVVTVAVTVTVGALRRVVREQVRIVAIGVVTTGGDQFEHIYPVTVSVRPLGRVVAEHVRGVRPPIPVAVLASHPVHGRVPGRAGAAIPVGPRAVVAVAVSVRVTPLGRVEWLPVTLSISTQTRRPVGIWVRPAVSVLVRAAEPVPDRIPPSVDTAVGAGREWLVTHPVTVGVVPLVGVDWEDVDVTEFNSVHRDQDSGPIGWSDADPGGVGEIVTVTISVSVIPLRGVVREAVNPAVWIGVPGIIGVVRIAVPVSVGPLQAIVRVGVVEVGPAVAVTVRAAEAVLGRVTPHVGALVRFVGRCRIVSEPVVV